MKLFSAGIIVCAMSGVGATAGLIMATPAQSVTAATTTKIEPAKIIPLRDFFKNPQGLTLTPAPGVGARWRRLSIFGCF